MKKKRNKRKVFEILKHPNDVLRAENAEIHYFDSNLVELAQDMIHTMRVVGGIGLAAPQIGKNVQLAVALIDKKPLVLVNPKILNGSVNGENAREGCLSVPGVALEIPRPTWIEVEYDDLRGRKHFKTFEDMNCVIICHEMDHLDGVLIIDHANEPIPPMPEV